MPEKQELEYIKEIRVPLRIPNLDNKSPVLFPEVGVHAPPLKKHCYNLGS